MSPSDRRIDSLESLPSSLESDSLEEDEDDEEIDYEDFAQLVDNACARSLTAEAAAGGLQKQFSKEMTHMKLTTLCRVLRHLFQLDNNFASTAQREHWVRRGARRVVEHPSFTGFFGLLTVYALFGPDLAIIYGDRDDDMIVSIFNLVALLLFLIELGLLCLSQNRYYCTGHFLLDLVAAVSLVGDTWLFHELLVSDALAAGRGSRLARVARVSRSTRLMKLTRVARVVRVTARLSRIVPKLLGGGTSVAEFLLKKRLWRVFRYLADGDNLVSVQDANLCQAALRRELLNTGRHPGENSRKFAKPRKSISRASRIFTNKVVGANDVEESTRNNVQFGKFLQLIMKMPNFSMRRHLLDEVERGSGVWNATGKLSERTAVRICVGVLVILVCLPMIEPHVTDNSPDRGLMLLDYATLQAEKEVYNVALAENLCTQVKAYAAQHPVMMLILNLRMYLLPNERNCILHPLREILTDGDHIKSVEMVMESSGLRDAEMLPICYPAQDCSAAGNQTKSIALLDIKEEFRETAMWSTYLTLAVIGLMLFFVWVFGREASLLNRQFIMPLRTLADDMSALTMMELIRSDAEFPTERESPDGVMEEMAALYKSFGAFRRALRSWAKYVPQAVALRLFSSNVEARLGVTKGQVSILFSAIDGFETTCRNLTPDQVLMVLSKVLSVISDVVERRGGTILEFIGDEVVAAFNAPIFLATHAEGAIRSAVDIHDSVSQLASWISSMELDIPPIVTYCGVNTAEMLAGNIGSNSRMKYGLLGDGINLAARLKGLNSRYHTRTLASDALVGKLHSNAPATLCRPVDKVAVKGRKAATTVYEPIMHIEDASEELIQAMDWHKQGFELYCQQRFQEALVPLRQVRDALEKHTGAPDRPSRMLLKRCANYSINPPPAEWDGVERLNQKTFNDDCETTIASDNNNISGERRERRSVTWAGGMFGSHMVDENGSKDEPKKSRSSKEFLTSISIEMVQSSPALSAGLEIVQSSPALSGGLETPEIDRRPESPSCARQVSTDYGSEMVEVPESQNPISSSRDVVDGSEIRSRSRFCSTACVDQINCRLSI